GTVAARTPPRGRGSGSSWSTRPAGCGPRRTTAWPCPATSSATCRNACRNCSATTFTRRSWGTSTVGTPAGSCPRIRSGVTARPLTHRGVGPGEDLRALALQPLLRQPDRTPAQVPAPGQADGDRQPAQGHIVSGGPGGEQGGGRRHGDDRQGDQGQMGLEHARGCGAAV